MVPVARKYTGLVYFPSALVGPSMSRLLCSHRRSGSRCQYFSQIPMLSSCSDRSVLSRSLVAKTGWWVERSKKRLNGQR